MIELIDFLTIVGQESLGAFWLPVGLWTFFALCITGILRMNDSIPTVYQLYSRSALLITLPLSILGSAAVGFWSAFNSSPALESIRFITIQSPIKIMEPLSAAAPISWGDPFLWVGLLLVILALGSVLSISYLIRNLYQLYTYSLRLEFEPLKAVFNHIVQSNTQPKVAFSKETEVPFTYGWVQPHIVLPEALRRQDQKLKLAIRHELMHINHQDFAINSFLMVIRCIFWFHPLTHILHNSYKEYREITCDNEVLADSSVSKKNYAELLYELATKSLSKNHVVISMAVHPSTLKKRIKMMNNQPEKSYGRSILLISFAVFFMVGIISCSDLQQNGLTQQEVKQMQNDMAQKPPPPPIPAENSPLFILNGERFEASKAYDVVPRIKTKYIKSINVLKGEKATAKYGEVGSHGVVEITLNAKEKALSDLMEEPPAPPEPGTRSDGGNYFIAVEEMPKLIGGLASLQKKINYPEEAREKNLEGQVIIQFIVNKEGDVENAQVIKGVAESVDQEALRVVRQAQFTPGMQRGEPVRVQYAIPITFRLQADSK